MADPLLSSLCTICRIQTPKYKCPRCAIQTCSLPCSRRHKLWSECNGVRDPTIYKPTSELYTPSGVDHDYNFIHSIEARVERTEKEIVEERGLVGKAELKAARNGEDERDKRKTKGRNLAPGEMAIDKCLKSMGIRVVRAPEGMNCRKENTTNWSKNQRCINWQVEYFREESKERFLARAMGNKPLGGCYDEACEMEKRANLTPEELKVLKKRKAEQQKQREKAGKRVKLSNAEASNLPITAEPILQDPRTSTWNISVEAESENSEPPAQDKPTYSQDKKFYLLRPYTPSSMPKVLVPLDASKPLSELLKRRLVLEYPTIYVFHQITPLPEDFMLEKDFLRKTGQPAFDSSDDESSEESGSDGADSDTSSSGDSDSSSEEGEK
ncbi:hypothetical protein HYALB_00005552 [Hymenoscyphus albidus]|uniref:Box C/D snoRNA protein 1 n=1 Tax=Hymenoscyphus albidus TaxID=595503 RepID=A0A9N9LJQ7_9HELO|nr:hypothetical protein HYALB_00005552 [Hymenoscyphus albidus]